MTTLLHLDSSARPGTSANQSFGSHTRRLAARFVAGWRAAHPDAAVIHRDLGAEPPQHVTGEWIHAAFTKPEQRLPWMDAVLRESDQLIDELCAADVIVAGVPMYNFNVPAQFKAYIDNIVRVGRTFGFDRARAGAPYWPLLDQDRKSFVILSSRGDHGYSQGQRIAHMNHVEPSITTALRYIGITDVHGAAVEFDEFGDGRLRASIVAAESQVDELVAQLGAQRHPASDS
ncbi:NAD(P)H dehydrogenase [Duganella sp. BJB488]|uniref:FMN-dependent NADH-azoreductase n=1 Tax=unclassified Duganella TaxID=2636909 RepID=UPI000E3572C9|nr:MULTISPECIES: NAD(P)H-dependent oxidoreductase [unclassified Duganella]RFP15200.1 NAD(P)H dehydrogenase [Duganella sp. BJB489]RFP19755.1 NAD(P)H dehydrogenase [Duganella sp. BJB488]RFP38143.1 NAD(P)H dehydrogenase [Duganella sp. BJB480]